MSYLLGAGIIIGNVPVRFAGDSRRHSTSQAGSRRRDRIRLGAGIIHRRVLGAGITIMHANSLERRCIPGWNLPQTLAAE